MTEIDAEGLIYRSKVFFGVALIDLLGAELGANSRPDLPSLGEVGPWQIIESSSPDGVWRRRRHRPCRSWFVPYFLRPDCRSNSRSDV